MILHGCHDLLRRFIRFFSEKHGYIQSSERKWVVQMIKGGGHEIVECATRDIDGCRT